MENFKGLNLPSEVLSSLERMNISTPTEIQKKTIPVAMQGFDVLASSQTGSGKTLAYLLPMLSAINNQSENKALILVPTRELAVQVQQNLNQIAHRLKLVSAVLIGGEPMPKQFAQLKRNPMVIIGTPGRIIDHLTRGSLKLTNTNFLVLDEMDRMLDMGMKEQLEEITKFLEEKRQVLMFSATMPKHIISMSQKYLTNPTRISVGEANQAAAEIKQEVLHVGDEEKFTTLVSQLETREGSVIVFVKTKRGADQLAKMLRTENHKAEAIHGDLTQNRRDKVISSFRSSKHRIMVATDVAARGLDIPHTQHVINYDLPMCPEDYLHRIGRTGRAGNSGFALSFISPQDRPKWRAIDRLINKGESDSFMGKESGDRKRSGGNNRSGGFKGGVRGGFKGGFNTSRDGESRGGNNDRKKGFFGSDRNDSGSRNNSGSGYGSGYGNSGRSRSVYGNSDHGNGGFYNSESKRFSGEGRARAGNRKPAYS